MTCEEVQAALVGFGSNCLWNPQRVLAARNTSGLVGWEADLLLVQPSGWVWEVEVKVSVADFRREFSVNSKLLKHQVLREGRHRGYPCHENLVRRYLFAMPTTVYQRVASEVPDYAGVILLDPGGRDRHGRLKPWIEKRAKELPARKASDADREALKTSVYFRYWAKVDAKK